MKCQMGTRHLLKICPKLFEYGRCLGITWNVPSASRHFPNNYINRLLVKAGGRGRCHIVVKLTGIVRHLADHLTPHCSTSRLYNYASVTFLYCIVCGMMVPLE